MISYRKFLESSSLLGLSGNVDDHLISIIKNNVQKGGSILEISCGNCEDSVALVKLGYNVISTEIDENYVNNAIKRGINCIKHDTKDPLPFKSGEFDLTYSRLSLHYFSEEELIKIFSEIRRVSRNILFTVKVQSDKLKTGKIIHSVEFWRDMVETFFNIQIFEVKTGKLYGEESRWLEAFAKK